MRDDELGTEYFLDVHHHQWSGGIGRPAGVYLIEGRTVFAQHASRAEEQLVEQGAILVATLLFGPDPLEATHPGHVIDRVRPVHLAGAPRLQNGN